ncbi:hypothetical protein MLD38_020350 [Melastoma candidum]|uniref:Uncharacterized protein n=1 Tax=Melastoma candidum TaxID=119954 RepID=A0ACB9QC77_9MYRT|nr:hypothetical protein MLD38_020350 [Melastoma candidum]
METLISGRCDLHSVPDSYVLSANTRPGKDEVPFFESIPVIDLGINSIHDRPGVVSQILEAAREFGLFQLTNHGISAEQMEDTLRVAKEFFHLPMEEKGKYFSEDPKQSCRLYTSIEYRKEKVHFWRDALRHPCYPLEDHWHSWPEKPDWYREVIGRFSTEVRKLSLLLLGLIGEGLGLEHGFFNEGLTRVQLLALNHYPPCPDPSLTLGLPPHGDVNLITVLLQGKVPGLQFLREGSWLAVRPCPGALLVNIGHALEVISNGNVRTVEHRVVTDGQHERTTVGSFIHPAYDSQIEPARKLVNDRGGRPLYKSVTYKDFVSTYIVDTYEIKPFPERYALKRD